MKLCVFCGSNTGHDPKYAEAAKQMAAELLRNGIDLVYGGGHVGLMGVIADSVLEGGGKVLGVMPTSLIDKEVGHNGLTEMIAVESMHERKEIMSERSDGFIAMPGGAGTFEEIFEQWTWAQLGFHAKPCTFLNIDGYYDPLIEMVQKSAREGFIKQEHIDMLIFETDPASLIDRIKTYEAPNVIKWINKP